MLAQASRCGVRKLIISPSRGEIARLLAPNIRLYELLASREQAAEASLIMRNKLCRRGWRKSEAAAKSTRNERSGDGGFDGSDWQSEGRK